jgi:hypothetical protein
MTISFSVFKPKFRRTIADAVYQEVTSGTATYYHWFGKENPWTDFLSPFIGSSAGDYPGQPSNNFRYDLHVRRDILTAKKIHAADISYVTRRIDWTYDTIYDMYDDSYGPYTGDPASITGYYGAENLEDANYFVLTSDYNIYKCIWNNNVKPSTIMPTGTTENIFTLSDGYKWKFMYSIPVSLRNRFLTSDYMPVSTALKAAYYGNGAIQNIFIQNGGTGYNPATTIATITGDGYSANNPYVFSSVTINTPTSGTLGGYGYLHTAGDFITATAAPTLVAGKIYTIASLGTTDFTQIGAISNTVGTTFRCTAPGTGTGTAGPLYKITSPGNTNFTSIGAANSVIGTTFVATGVGTGTGQAVLVPTVMVSYPFTSAVNWSAGATITPGEYIRSINAGVEYYYKVSSGTVLGTSPPTQHIIGGTEANGGSAQLTYVGKNSTITATLTDGSNGTTLNQSLALVNVSDGGYGYQGTPTLYFTSPKYTTINWTPSSSWAQYTIIQYQGRYYKVVSASGLSALTGPTDVSGSTFYNGSAQLQYVAQDPSLTPVVTKTEASISLNISPRKDLIQSIAVTSTGKKYSEVPTITIAGPGGTGATATATATIGDFDTIYEGQVKLISVTNGGTGYTAVPLVTVATPKITFDGSSSAGVSTSNYSITKIRHKFVSGDAVVYNNGGGTSVTGLTSGNTYYVIYVDANTLKLASSYVNALAGTQVNLTGYGSNLVTGTPSHTLQLLATGEAATAVASLGAGGEIIGYSFIDQGVGYTNCNIQITDANSTRTFNAGTSVNLTLEQITLYQADGSTGHGLSTGTQVKYSVGLGGSVIGGLVDGGTYYIINIAYNTVQLATSAANASSSIYINLSSLGSGTATFTIPTAGSGAILVADFNPGDVSTLQANVELLAVPGSIETMKVVNGGQNYSSAILDVLGDGTGCTAVATCEGGKIIHIEVTNPGSGYSWTDVRITGNSGSDGGAIVRAIMSPLGGHGSNAIDELNGNSLVFYTSLGRDINQGIEITNDYRKAGLIRNLKKFGSNTRFTDEVGFGTVLIEFKDNTGNINSKLAQLVQDMLLYKVEPSGIQNYKKYRIIEIKYVDDYTGQVLLSVFNNFTINVGDQLITDPTDIGHIINPTQQQIQFTVTAAYERTFDQFSGDFLFFTVREPYVSSAEQIVTVRTQITI